MHDVRNHTQHESWSSHWSAHAYLAARGGEAYIMSSASGRIQSGGGGAWQSSKAHAGHHANALHHETEMSAPAQRL